jgi:hypothetical protein
MRDKRNETGNDGRQQCRYSRQHYRFLPGHLLKTPTSSTLAPAGIYFPRARWSPVNIDRQFGGLCRG